MTKYQGSYVIYIEGYSDKTWCHPDMCRFMPFDADILQRMAANVQYEEDECEGWSLKNALIAYYNEEDIDFSSIIIDDKKSLVNYYYIPIILAIYKSYITGLQTGSTTTSDSSDDSTSTAVTNAAQTLYNALNGLDTSSTTSFYNNPLGGIET